MCGIFGAINFNGYFNDSEIKQFKKLTNLVTYRGPDNYGFFINRQKNIFLGHRRLKILDLTDKANQPMQFKKKILIYNGEIFNYQEIKKTILKNCNFSFESNSDTEIILKSLECFGNKIINKWDGMWSFLLWDEEKQELLVSRDRFGIKPLFYLNFQNKLYFASEIKQLLPLLPKKEFNRKIIFHFLKQGILDFDNETFFNKINRFPAGEIWEINKKGEIRRKKYWQFEPNENFQISEKEAIEQFRDLLIKSIQKRLIADVPVGVLLSGGLDSSTIVALLVKYFKKDEIQTFSIIGDYKKFTEEIFIDEVINKLQIKNRKIIVTANKIKFFIEKSLIAQDEPYSSLSIPAQFYLFKEIKEHFNEVVILSGQGGDEILGGYRKYFFFYIKELIKQRKWNNLLILLFHSFIHRTVLWQFNVLDAKRYMPNNQSEKCFLKDKFPLEPIWFMETLKKRQLKDIRKYSLPILTRYEDRNSMFHSLEVRHPFLDYKLLEFGINLSNNLKVKDGWLKYILRKSIIELPNKIAWRRDKQGFLLPQNLWLKRELKKELENSLNSSALIIKNNIIDWDKLQNYYYNSFKNIDYNLIFRIFITEKWLQYHFR